MNRRDISPSSFFSARAISKNKQQYGTANAQPTRTRTFFLCTQRSTSALFSHGWLTLNKSIQHNRPYVIRRTRDDKIILINITTEVSRYWVEANTMFVNIRFGMKPVDEDRNSTVKRIRRRRLERWPFGKTNRPSAKRIAPRQNEWPFGKAFVRAKRQLRVFVFKVRFATVVIASLRTKS